MQPLVQRILVVGGNGFIGSAVCKLALARGMQVTSISSSGRPYQTPKGHSPAWTSEVEWRAADALRPESYADVLPEVGGVVHTLGTLLEDGGYKEKIKNGDLLGFLGSFFGGGAGNPLDDKPKTGTYETLNRDAALRVCETFTASENKTSTMIRPFIYISAEDIFRPLISGRYIETKREAEHLIEEMMLHKSDSFRGVYIRPSLVYHAHQRPMTSPLAALLDLSATIHSKVPLSIPTPSAILRTLASVSPVLSPLNSTANALATPPIHVDHVAEAICASLNDPNVRGVVNVRRMREIIGWRDSSADTAHLV